MGNSCTCIKKSNENELETFEFHGARLGLIIKIQSIWRGYSTRKQIKTTKGRGKSMGALNSKKKTG